jgi:hypothetical protein
MVGFKQIPAWLTNEAPTWTAQQVMISVDHIF